MATEPDLKRKAGRVKVTFQSTTSVFPTLGL